MGAQELQRNEVTPDVEALIDRVRTAHREAQAQADKAKEARAILERYQLDHPDRTGYVDPSSVHRVN